MKMLFIQNLHCLGDDTEWVNIKLHVNILEASPVGDFIFIFHQISSSLSL